MGKFFRVLRVAFTLFLVATAALSLAQSTSYHLHLNGGSFLPPANMAQPFPDAPSPEEVVEGRYYRVVQFFRIPRNEEKKALEQAGLRLQGYLPSMAYWASIDSGITPSSLSGYGIRSWIALEPKQKTAPALLEVPLPIWACQQPGTIDLELSFHQDLGPEWASLACLGEGFQLLEPGYGGVVRVRVPVHRILDLAAKPWVSYLEPLQPPSKLENYTGRTLHRSNVVASDHPMGRHYDGTGVVVAMGDDGIIGPHIDFQGRLDQSRVFQNNGTHGDHVAGIICGAGNLNPKNKGMAFGATLHVYQVWDAVNDGPAANASQGTLYTSTSYSDGCNAGYTSFASSADLSIYQTPILLHVFSGGNEGTGDCGYGAGAGWGNVTGGVKVGKNVLAVASLNANGVVESYSSRGPAADGRLKPEVSAKGGNVTSTFPDNTYSSQSGTSMACPGASGTLAQLAQAYRNLNSGQDPPSALMKAVLMNGCDDKGNLGPDFKYGFGEMNALRSVIALEQHTYFADTVQQSELDSFQITVPAGLSQLKVMLYWHDAPGTVGAAIPLVNNLDLQVIDPSNQTILPWILNHSPSATSLNAVATRGRDSINNVEQVTVNAPTPGVYSIQVQGYQIPSTQQAYHLVYEFRDSAVTLTYPFGGESWAPGEVEKLRWDSEINPSAWELAYSSDSGSTWTVINANVAGTQRHLDWTVPSTLQSGRMLVRVKAGNIEDVSDYPFSVIRVPGNLTVAAACPSYCTLRWDSLPSAAAYDVFMLGNKFMDSVGTTTNRSFNVQGIDPNQGYWFAVRAKAADGALGRRCIAIYKNPGIWNCLEPNDLGVSAIPGPGAGVLQSCVLNGDLVVTVTIQNHSPNTVSNIPVSYQVDNGPVVTETFTGNVPGSSSAQYTFAGTSTPPSLGSHVIKAWTSFGPDGYAGNDTSSIVVEMKTGAVKSAPYAEDFESFNLCSVTVICENGNCALINDWIQGINNLSDNADWRTDRGGTPTLQTGPDVDHNPGTNLGKYLYVEASSCTQRQAMLYTPCLDLSGMTNPYFSYWFNMYGAAMGDLHVDLFAGGAWIEDITTVASGNWGINWWVRQIDLSAYAGQIIGLRFRGVTGSGELSDIAIDDVKLTEGPPVANDLGSLDLDLQVYPNPSEAVFKVDLNRFESSELRLTVRDLAGREVLHKEFAADATGRWSGEIDLRGQTAGVYSLELETSQQLYTRKLVLMP